MNEKDKEYYSRPDVKKRRKVYMKNYNIEHNDEMKQYSKDYFQNNSEKWKTYRSTWENSVGREQVLLLARLRRQKSDLKLKLETYKQYTSDLKCQNCKHKLDLRFLSIQHLRGRKEHNHDRKMTGSRMNRWLKKNNYPKKDFEVWCFNCNSSEGKRHTDKPKTFISKYQKHYFTKYLPVLIQSKEKCLEYYGRKCACCGETKLEWLSIEHKAGKKGALHPKGQAGIKLFRWLDLNGFPKGYEIFCYNCNSAKGNFGICPHKDS